MTTEQTREFTESLLETASQESGHQVPGSTERLWCTRICVCGTSKVLFRAGTQGHVSLLPPKRVVLSTCKRVSPFKRAASRLARDTGVSHASFSKTLSRRGGTRTRKAV